MRSSRPNEWNISFRFGGMSSLHSSLKGRQEGPGGARFGPGRWKSTPGTERKNNIEQGYIKQSKSDHILNISKITSVQTKLSVLILLTKFGQMNVSQGRLPPPSLSHNLERGGRRNHVVWVFPSHSQSLGAHLTPQYGCVKVMLMILEAKCDTYFMAPIPCRIRAQ